MPVSAPLALAAQHQDNEFWSRIIRLACESEPDALQHCLIGEKKFRRHVDGCSLEPAEREALLASKLPWPSLKIIIGIANATRHTNPEMLRGAVRDASQIDFLRSELDRRFFSRSRLLKVLNVVAKAKAPGQIAQVRLQNERARIRRLCVEMSHYLAILEDRIKHGDADLAHLNDFVVDFQSNIRVTEESLSRALVVLGEMTKILVSLYEDFSRDMNGLETIEDMAVKLDPKARRMLQCLFGINGPTLDDRLRFLSLKNASFTDESDDELDSAIEEIRSLESLSRDPLRSVCSHGVRRLEQLANHVDMINWAGPDHEGC